jgi:alpha-tubulin suppressor-like RCC1 family protein
MISVKDLITLINSQINTAGLSEEQVLQLCAAVGAIENNGLSAVNTENDLPPAILNTGRLMYIENDYRYVMSDGARWSTNTLIKAVSAYAWGNGNAGRLGDGTAVSRSSPVSVVGGYTDWIQVAGGNAHNLGLRANGTAWAWGLGTSGQLGDDTAVTKSSPVSVVGGFTDWIQVGAGDTHSLGIRANGTAWAWGRALEGQLGDDTIVAKSSPVSVVGGYTDWIQVDGSSLGSLGVRANGTAWAWGNGSFGRLGDGTTVDKSSPVSVVGGFTDWLQVSGDSHNVGLRANGTVWAWGLGASGQLGNGFILTRSSPVSVVGGFTDWIQVDAGASQSLGLRANGTAWAWGGGTSGRLGDGTILNRSSPVSVVGGYTDWIQVSAGDTHGLGLRANGTAWAWGLGTLGRLGDNTIVDKSSPVSVVGGFTDWIQIDAGSSHSLGIR